MSVIRKEEIIEEFRTYEPIFFIVNILAHKWSLYILLSLKTPMYFNQLQKKLKVSHTVLSKHLKELESLKMLERKVITTTNPPSVEYSLTGYGEALVADCMTFMKWSTLEAEFTSKREPKW